MRLFHIRWFFPILAIVIVAGGLFFYKPGKAATTYRSVTLHWSGVYVDEDSGPSSFIGIHSNLSVPCLQGGELNNPRGSGTHSFIGLGGVYGSLKIFEVGVASDPGESPFAYWATSDNKSDRHRIQVNIVCGDNVSLGLIYSNNVVTFGVINRGINFERSISFTPDIASAEWITARDSCGGYSFLPDFTPVHWSFMNATVPEGTYGSAEIVPGQTGYTAVNMVDANKNHLAFSSDITEKNISHIIADDEFTTTWNASGADGHLC